jgi:Leucine-rich repeat (LRR) protein
MSECGLTGLAAPAWTSLAPNLLSLDLSGNLFIEVPAVLSSLYCLRSLSLAGNLINGLQGLNLNSLPAITTLILRDNKITSLAGIERGARNLIT